ncbi:hypothetical protein [Candidatus Viadribacter manganicus]|uniref:hypothetical protein n=1 Tax=Candidatus Viadribacter manganicus TaxID=1759059 RepID=UPI001D1733FE|nr:hypothetical protein [Candidatus Viadribacter manganicus]
MRTLLAISVLVFVVSGCTPPAPAPSTPSAVAVEPAATVATGELEMFTSPSGNIGCTYVPSGGTAVYQPAQAGAELTCDRSEPTYVRVVLPENGPAHVVETDERGCCSGEALAYGQTWSRGPFRCESSEQGVTCTSAGGHRLSLNRERADVN